MFEFFSKPEGRPFWYSARGKTILTLDESRVFRFFKIVGNSLKPVNVLLVLSFAVALVGFGISMAASYIRDESR